jgi:hypothetical protein
VFLFSTDFDASGQPHEIDPAFRIFGQSWTIFTPDTLRELIGRFEARGYTLVDPSSVDLHHAERPINWQGQDYTFVMVALRAPAVKHPRPAG